MVVELKELGRAVRREHLSKLVEIANSIANPNVTRAAILGRITMLYARLVKLILKGYSLIKGV